MRPPTIVKRIETIVLIAFMWTIWRSPVQCFFLWNPFNSVQSVSTFTGQPITLKVPKNQIDNLKHEVQTNPKYLQQLFSQSTSPNGIGQSISLSPAGIGGVRGLESLSSMTNGYPSVGQGPVTVALPKVTTIGGQQYFLTSRANLLWNKGANFLKNVASSIITPLSSKLIPTNYFNNGNGLNQGNVAKIITNDETNMDTTEDDDGDDDDDDDEEEEEEEVEEEIQNTKNPRNKRSSKRNKNNKTKNDSDLTESSEVENSSGNEEQSEEISKRKSNDGKKRNDRSSMKKRDESNASASGSVSGGGSYTVSASE